MVGRETWDSLNDAVIIARSKTTNLGLSVFSMWRRCSFRLSLPELSSPASAPTSPSPSFFCLQKPLTLDSACCHDLECACHKVESTWVCRQLAGWPRKPQIIHDCLWLRWEPCWLPVARFFAYSARCHESGSPSHWGWQGWNSWAHVRFQWNNIPIRIGSHGLHCTAANYLLPSSDSNNFHTPRSYLNTTRMALWANNNFAIVPIHNYVRRVRMSGVPCVSLLC